MWVEFESYKHRHSHEENGNVTSFGVHDGRQDAILKRGKNKKRVTPKSGSVAIADAGTKLPWVSSVSNRS